MFFTYLCTELLSRVDRIECRGKGDGGKLVVEWYPLVTEDALLGTVPGLCKFVKLVSKHSLNGGVGLEPDNSLISSKSALVLLFESLWGFLGPKFVTT